jgi:hypothetical protein
MPLFSVVIPTYNRRERLLRALRSVLAQTFVDYEIIVVDDGSSDGTMEALAGVTGPVTAIRQANRGPAAARSTGVRAATGDFIAFLDSDDTWFPWTLASYADAVKQNDRLGWLYGGGVANPQAVNGSNGKTPMVCRSFPDYFSAASVDGLMPLASGVAISRQLLLALGGLNESMRVAEDVDLWFRLGGASPFVLIESPPLYLREIHEGSLGEDVPRSFEGMMKLVERERLGEYRGSKKSGFVRRGIITRQLMYYAEKYQQHGQRSLAARVYLEVLKLQAQSGFREPGFGGWRNRFLLAFPVLLLAPSLHRQLAAVLSTRPARRAVGDRG